MGHSAIHQAIPERGALFEFLQTDRQGANLLLRLSSEGASLDPDKFDGEIVANVFSYVDEAIKAGTEEDFESMGEVDSAFQRLSAILRAECAANPGLASRATLVDKVFQLIHDRLMEELKLDGRDDAAGLVGKLIGGATPTSCFSDGVFSEFWLIPAAMVQEGASVLRTMEPTRVIKQDWSYIRNDYKSWRTMLLEAADRGEAVLVIG